MDGENEDVGRMQPHVLAALFDKPGSAQDAYRYLKNKDNMKTLARMLTNPDEYPLLEWKIVQQTPLSVVDLVYTSILCKLKIPEFRLTPMQMVGLRKEQKTYLERLYHDYSL